MDRYQAEEVILSMADIVCENRKLREKVEELELQMGIEKARFWGKKELKEKLEKRYSENLSYNLVRSSGWLSNDTKGYIPDMDDLSKEDYEFLNSHVLR